MRKIWARVQVVIRVIYNETAIRTKASSGRLPPTIIATIIITTSPHWASCLGGCGLDKGPKINGIGPMIKWPNCTTHQIQTNKLGGKARQMRHATWTAPSPQIQLPLWRPSMYISPYTEITTLYYHDHHRNRSITTHHRHVGDGRTRRNRLDHGVSMIVIFHNSYL